MVAVAAAPHDISKSCFSSSSSRSSFQVLIGKLPVRVFVSKCTIPFTAIALTLLSMPKALPPLPRDTRLVAMPYSAFSPPRLCRRISQNGVQRRPIKSNNPPCKHTRIVR